MYLMIVYFSAYFQRFTLHDVDLLAAKCKYYFLDVENSATMY